MERKRNGRGDTRPYLPILILISSLLFFGTALYYVRAGINPTGDEPHFLIITQTLLKYHSLNVMADYLHGDYHSFYSAVIQPHITKNARGQTMPLHSIGGPLLWLIPFALLGRLGAVWFISALSVLIIINIYKCMVLLGIRPGYAFITALLYACASPLFIFSYLTFIEPIAAFICLYVFRKLLEDDMSTPALLLCSCLLGLLAWVHIRLVSFEALLWCFMCYRIYSQWRWRRPLLYLWWILPIFVLSALFEVYTIVYWGTFNPSANQIYGGSTIFEVLPFKGMLGIFFDQDYGLLVCFPLCFLFVAGIVLAWHKQFRRYNFYILLLSIPYIIEFTSFRNWGGGWSPPGRFMLVLLPLYAVLFGFALQCLPGRLSYALSAIMFVWGFGYNLLALLPPDYSFNASPAHNNALAHIKFGNIALTSWLPSVLSINLWVLLPWIFAYLMITVGVIVLGQRNSARHDDGIRVQVPPEPASEQISTGVQGIASTGSR